MHLLRSKNGLKPVGRLVLDTGHPLAIGLEGCWVLGEGGGRYIHDLTQKNPPGSIYGTAVNYSVNQAGSGLSFPNSTTRGVYANENRALISGRRNLTILARLAVRDLPQAEGRAIYCERPTSGNDIVKLETGVNAISTTAPIFTYRDDAGSLTRIPGATNIVLNVSNDVVAWKSGTTLKVFVNGKEDGSTTTAASDTLTNSGIKSVIGSDPQASSAAVVGFFNHVYVWSRALLPCELQWLTVEPYAFVKQAPYRSIFIPTAANSFTGTSYVAAPAATLTASGTIVNAYTGTSAVTAAAATLAATGTLVNPATNTGRLMLLGIG